MGWESRTVHPSATRGFSSGVIAGKLYAAVQSQHYEYDPAGDSWASKTAAPVSRQYTASGVYNSRLYFFGGGGASGYYYTASTDTWSSVLASMPGGDRQQFAGAFIGSTFYAAGGYNGSFLTRLEAYDASGDSWSTKTSMGTARVDPVVISDGTYLYVCGGQGTGSHLTTVERYDVGGDSWSTLASMANTHSAGSGCYHDGKLYVAGGSDAGSGNGTQYFDVYDITSDTWTDLTSTDALPTQGRRHSAFGVTGDAFYVASGFGTGSDTDAHHRYVFPTGGWTVGSIRF